MCTSSVRVHTLEQGFFFGWKFSRLAKISAFLDFWSHSKTLVFWITRNRLKMRKIWGWNYRGIQSHFFQENWSKLSLILFLLCFLHCSSTFDTQRTFVTLQFTCPMTQKSLNLVKALRKYWKIFDDKYMFGDGWFYPKSQNWLKKRKEKKVANTIGPGKTSYH